jgi:chemotaxis methyl-accepting protein methylase
MSRRYKVNRILFSTAPAQSVGRVIYGWRLRAEPRAQATYTKFFRNLTQLSVFEGPLAQLASGDALRVLQVGCSTGCETYTLAGYLAVQFPKLHWCIDAVDISEEVISFARRGHYGREHGLGLGDEGLARKIEAQVFDKSNDGWTVKPEVRNRVQFHNESVLAKEFDRFQNYDVVLGQNFMIHMDDATEQLALAGLVNAARSGGALLIAGMHLANKAELIRKHNLLPTDWKLRDIHNEDEVRRNAWPWHYWSLEPIDERDPDYVSRYSTAFIKQAPG